MRQATRQFEDINILIKAKLIRVFVEDNRKFCSKTGAQPEIRNEGLFLRFGGSPQPPEADGGLREEPPALEKFAFFCKNNFILGLF